MNRGLITITRGLVYLAGVGLLVICVILLPEIAREEATSATSGANQTWPFLIGAWVLAIPIFVALYQTLRFLHCIEKGEAFSDKSVRAIRNIRTCAALFGGLLVFGTVLSIVWVRSIDPAEDVTHIITLGIVFAFAASVIAAFAAVVQRLLQNAVDIKSENDLTV